MWRLKILFPALALLAIGCTPSDENKSGKDVPVEDSAATDTLGQSTPARPLSPEEVAEKTFPSVVLLVMEDGNGQPVSLGSGFFVEQNVIATNLHVLEGAAGGYAQVVGKDKKHVIDGYLAIDAKHDLALLKVETSNEDTLEVDSTHLDVGNNIYAIGNPRGLEGTFSEGIVSGIREINGESFVQITAPISTGSSGGPVLDKNGNIVGVAFATFKGGQNLNFAIPSKYLDNLIDNYPRRLKSLSLIGQKSKNVFESEIGKNRSEGVVGTHFNWTDNEYMGKYTFSVRNKLEKPVENVICLVIFYANSGKPIDTKLVRINGPIPGNLAERSPKLGRISADEVRNITSWVEIRVLDFDILR